MGRPGEYGEPRDQKQKSHNRALSGREEWPNPMRGEVVCPCSFGGLLEVKRFCLSVFSLLCVAWDLRVWGTETSPALEGPWEQGGDCPSQVFRGRTLSDRSVISCIDCDMYIIFLFTPTVKKLTFYGELRR